MASEALEHAVEAVLDGIPVDWSALESATDLAELEIVRQLRLLSEISEVQRAAERTLPAQWGRLELIELIGEGAFGEVYRARDPLLLREVALKLLRRQAGQEAALREAQLLARVRHPNVVTILEAEEIDGRIGFWMEFVQGETLAGIVARDGPLDPPDVLRVGIDLCRALEAVHQAGLLHRDVKAQNVMRTADGRPVLMDFGTGRAIDVAAPGQVAGTPAYLAPEVFAGSEASRASDLYSVGVLLFHVATGAYPVRGRTLEELRAAHRAGEYASIAELRPEFPSGLARAIGKALDPDPVRRYASAAEMAGALEALSRPEKRSSGWRVAAVAALAALTISVAAIWVGSFWLGGSGGSGSVGRPSQGADSGPVRRRINLPGVTLKSNPSQDDRYFAFSDLDGNLSLHELATGKSRIIVRGTEDWSQHAYHSTIAPDSNHIAYSWNLRECGCMELRVVAVDGSPPRVLVHDERIKEIMFGEWSDDQHFILAQFSLKDSSHQLVLVSADDGARRILRTSSEVVSAAALSRDGRWVVYNRTSASEPYTSDLYVLATDGTHEQPLLEGPGNDFAPTWTPDGTRILFLSDRTGGIGLWLLEVAEGRPRGVPRIVKKDMGRIWPGRLTRSGSYYYGEQAGVVDVYTARLDARAETVLEPPKVIPSRLAGSNMMPGWSTDGRSLAYVAMPVTMGRPTRALAILSLDSGNERTLPLDVEYFSLPHWSPDGRLIALEGKPKEGKGALMLVDAQTGALRDALPETEDIAIMAWAPDSRHLYFGQKGSIWEFDLASRKRREVWRGEGRSFIALSADGQWIGFSLASPERRSIQLVPAAGGPARELFYSTEREVIKVWGFAGSALLFTRQPAPREKQTQLWGISIHGGVPYYLGITMDLLREVAVHPDGRTLAFTAGASSVENWVLQNFLPAQ